MADTTNTAGRPPQSPHSSANSSSAPQGSGHTGSKTRKRSSSDSPSGSATNSHGRSEVDQKLRSVLSHPLGLPLVSTLHGQDPSALAYLSRESDFYSDDGTESTMFDDLFEHTVNVWKTNEKRTEPHLTKALAKAIEARHTETRYHATDEMTLDGGRIDILFKPDEDNSKPGEKDESTPLAIIEVGRHDDDWWKKLDQALKYLSSLGKEHAHKGLDFAKPVILGVLTIEGESNGEGKGEAPKFAVRLGVFLCSPRGTRGGDYRISLLWRSNTSSLATASTDFARLLRAISDFSRWTREPVSWEYLGPNCCKVVVGGSNGKEPKTFVLRSYDDRFRATQRKKDVYLTYDNLECEVVLTVTKNGQAHENDMHLLWRPEGKLDVIAVPYMEGTHDAKTPAEFEPIICELEKLHKAGFVHGDIRGFNTVFSRESGKGWLIDFDFGGKEDDETTVYPQGYKKALEDGMRPGSGGQPIRQWHDWSSLGALIFQYHRFVAPAAADKADFRRLKDSWEDIEGPNRPTREMIEELKEFCLALDQSGWKVKPSIIFRDVLDVFKTNDAGPPATDPNATGSPPGKVKGC